MDRGAWKATVHGVAKSQPGLSDFHFLFPMLEGSSCKPSEMTHVPGERGGFPGTHRCVQATTCLVLLLPPEHHYVFCSLLPHKRAWGVSRTPWV